MLPENNHCPKILKGCPGKAVFFYWLSLVRVFPMLMVSTKTQLKMRNILFFLILVSLRLSAQNPEDFMEFEPGGEYPYGRLNPEAPEGTGDFDSIIGTCDCKSVSRNPDQTWADTTKMVWRFKYIMNGMAVQDEVWRENDRYAGSIRQYQPDSAQWVVTYFSQPGVPWSPAVWHGGKKENGNIILFNPQKAPSGMDGFYKITFYDISREGFNWKGEWVDQAQTFSFPTWMIFCKKREE